MNLRTVPRIFLPFILVVILSSCFSDNTRFDDDTVYTGIYGSDNDADYYPLYYYDKKGNQIKKSGDTLDPYWGEENQDQDNDYQYYLN